MRRALPLILCTLLHSSASAFQVSLEVVHAGCGNASGSITVAVSGGSGPYSYLWTPTPPSGQGAPNISGLAPGSYTVDVTDAMAVTSSATGTVLALPGLDVATALSNSGFMRACPGQCTGQLYLTNALLGGVEPYAISTVPPMPLNALCGNAPFDVVVSDANGCMGTATTMVPEVVYPSLVGTLLNGPCPGAPTSVEAFFDPPYNNWWSVTSPGGAPTYTTAGPNGGLAIGFPQSPGMYSFNYMPDPPCPAQSYQVIYPSSNTDCSDVDGFLYVDVNGNCVKDGSDFPLPQRIVTLNPGGYSTMSDFLGHYRIQVPYGTYDLTYSDPIYTQNCPVASPVNFTLDAVTPNATIDLALTSSDPDVAISCAIGQAVPGFTQTHWLTVTNNSAIPSGPLTVTLDHDLLLTYSQVWYCAGGGPYLDAIGGYWGGPNSWVPGQAQWNLPNGLAPGAQAFLRIELLVPPDPLLIGTTFNCTATVNTALNDVDLSNNVCSHSEVVVGSFDPNDKQARTNSGSGSTYDLEQDSIITYTIRFQNTGTAPAVNVVLADTLSLLLDLGTLSILGASDRYTTSLSADRVLRFTFDRIMLPDSGSNEPASHGFAQFNVHPMQGLVPGSLIDNAADIFFDFNPPIRTNTSELFVEFNTGLTLHDTDGFVLYPDPADDLLMFGLPGQWMRNAVVYAMDGRVVRRVTNVTSHLSVDGLEAGTYVLRLVDGEGNALTARFVKR